MAFGDMQAPVGRTLNPKPETLNPNSKPGTRNPSFRLWDVESQKRTTPQSPPLPNLKIKRGCNAPSFGTAFVKSSISRFPTIDRCAGVSDELVVARR